MINDVVLVGDRLCLYSDDLVSITWIDLTKIYHFQIYDTGNNEPEIAYRYKYLDDKFKARITPSAGGKLSTQYTNWCAANYIRRCGGVSDEQKARK